MNPRITAGAIVLVLAAVAVFLIIGQGDLETPDPQNPRLGLVINAPGPSTVAELGGIYSQAASTGAGRSNVYLFWNLLEPERGQFEWAPVDLVMDLNKRNGLKVTLYFSLINGHTIGPLPEWVGASEIDEMDGAQLARTIDAILSRYDMIDTLIISGGTEEQFRYRQEMIPAYRDVFSEIYDLTSTRHPQVAMGNSFALHNVINKNLGGLVEELSYGDFVAFSYFPIDALNEISKSPADARADLDLALGMTKKPVIFFETGWATSEFVNGDEDEQARFVSVLLEYAVENAGRIESVTWYRQFDRHEGTCAVQAGVPGAIDVRGASLLGTSEFTEERLGYYLCSSGLLYDDGGAKPAWAEFQRRAAGFG